jgi:hypothetical protein
MSLTRCVPNFFYILWDGTNDDEVLGLLRNAGWTSSIAGDPKVLSYSMDGVNTAPLNSYFVFSQYLDGYSLHDGPAFTLADFQNRYSPSPVWTS